MVRWLEKNGYDVTYFTDIDLHQSGDSILSRHHTFLSVGHDEYYSREMRQNVENALNNGTNVAFFGANAVYWQIRLEPDSNGAADRTMVCYKYGGDPLGHTNLATVTWRSFPVNEPEAELIGVMYFGDPEVLGDIVISDASFPLFNHTGLHNGDKLTGLLGYEVDAWVPGVSPANTVVLAKSPAGPFPNDFDRPPGFSCDAHVQMCDSNMTWYSAGRAFVFATGSMQWAWGLDDYNTPNAVGSPNLRPAFSSAAAQTLTANVLAAFANGALPAPVDGIQVVPQQDGTK
jgi:hypothetical protein